MKVALTPACRPGGGGGHVVRCLALARALEARGAACSFVLESAGVAILRRLGWTGPAVAAAGEASRLQVIRGAAPDAVVVDDYGLDAAFEARLGAPVMVIDDLADRPHACALLLDSAYGRAETDYVSLAPGAQLLMGTDFVLLRDGFASIARRPAEQVGRVFVCFGFSDVGGVAARSVRTLRRLLPDGRFDVALGADAPSRAEIERLSQADDGVALHVDADVLPLMQAADVGVGAGGGMVWERRAAGLPQLVVTLAENQRPMAHRLAEAGVIALVDLEDPDFEGRLSAGFAGLMPADVRRAQIDRPDARCDGLGAVRVATALLDRLLA